MPESIVQENGDNNNDHAQREQPTCRDAFVVVIVKISTTNEKPDVDIRTFRTRVEIYIAMHRTAHTILSLLGSDMDTLGLFVLELFGLCFGVVFVGPSKEDGR
jgi:hypothetical protein